MIKLVKYKSIYIKLLILIIIAISLLYYFNVQINILASKDVKTKTVETAISKLDYYVSNMEHDVTIIMSAQKRLLINQELISLSSGKYEMNVYQRKTVIDNLQVKLLEIREISRLIDDAYIYMPLLNKKISSERVVDLTENDNIKIKDTISEQNYSYPFMKMNGSICINLTAINTELSNYDTIVPLFLISVEFSQDVLKEELSQIAGNEEYTALFIAPRFHLSNRADSNEIVDNKVIETVRSNKNEDTIEYSENVKVDGHDYILIYKHPKMLNVAFANYIPEEYFFHSLNIYYRWLLMFTVLTLLIVFIVAFRLYKMIAIPLNNLVEAFERTHDGNFNIKVEYDKNDEFFHVYEGFNQMFLKIRQLIQSVYEQKIYVQSAQLKQLQYQINPHFLYNTMFIIYRMSKAGDCENITKLSEYLGKYYQYITKGPLDAVKLSEEVAHTSYYIEIQMIRFSERVSCSFDPIPPNCENILVPKLMLQPIIENAFVHGLEKRAEGGNLLIRQRLEGEALIVTVEDNGTVIDGNKMKGIQERLDDGKIEIDTSGLINVHRRLKIMFGEEYGISVSESKMGGFKVTVKIPIEKE